MTQISTHHHLMPPGRSHCPSLPPEIQLHYPHQTPTTHTERERKELKLLVSTLIQLQQVMDEKESCGTLTHTAPEVCTLRFLKLILWTTGDWMNEACNQICFRLCYLYESYKTYKLKPPRTCFPNMGNGEELVPMKKTLQIK